MRGGARGSRPRAAESASATFTAGGDAPAARRSDRGSPSRRRGSGRRRGRLRLAQLNGARVEARVVDATSAREHSLERGAPVGDHGGRHLVACCCRTPTRSAQATAGMRLAVASASPGLPAASSCAFARLSRSSRRYRSGLCGRRAIACAPSPRRAARARWSGRPARGWRRAPGRGAELGAGPCGVDRVQSGRRRANRPGHSLFSSNQPTRPAMIVDPSGTSRGFDARFPRE